MMTNEEAIKILEVTKAECEWNAPLDYQEAFDMAIEALKEQSKHNQNVMQKQPDLDTLGIKTGETCEDVISRRDAIDAVEFGTTYAKVLNKETGEVMELFKKSNEELQKAVDRIEALPSAQPEQSNASEFWRKRADFYSDMCMNLIGEMVKSVKIESVKISENGIEFIKEQPPAQPEIIRCKDCRFWQNQEEGVVEVPICARPENRHEKHPFRFIVGADGYCSFAERITDE